MILKHGDREVALNEDETKVWNSLSLLQKGFVVQTLKGKSPVDAYLAAGGTATTYASQASGASILRHNPNVYKIINIFDSLELSPLIMGPVEMAERLSTMARTNISDVVTFIDSDAELLDMETGEITTGPAHWSLKKHSEMGNGGVLAISEVTSTKEGLKIKLHDQKAAMKQLAELQGYDKPKKTEVTVSKGLEDFYGGLLDASSDT